MTFNLLWKSKRLNSPSSACWWSKKYLERPHPQGDAYCVLRSKFVFLQLCAWLRTVAAYLTHGLPMLLCGISYPLRNGSLTSLFHFAKTPNKTLTVKIFNAQCAYGGRQSDPQDSVLHHMSITATLIRYMWTVYQSPVHSCPTQIYIGRYQSSKRHILLTV